MKRVEAGRFQRGNSLDEAQRSSFPQHWIGESRYQSDSLVQLMCQMDIFQSYSVFRMKFPLSVSRNSFCGGGTETQRGNVALKREDIHLIWLPQTPEASR